MVIIQKSKKNRWPDQTPPYPRRLRVLKNQAGLLAHGHCYSAPSHTIKVQWVLQTAPIYSGGTALEFHQLPY